MPRRAHRPGPVLVLWTVAALAATGGLHVLAHVTSPPMVQGGALPRHVGERVRTEAVVVDVRAANAWTQLDARAGATVLRLVVPPRLALTGTVPGTRIIVDGTIEMDEGRLTVFVLGLTLLDDTVSGAEPLAAALVSAPHRVGSRVAVAGDAQPAGRGWRLVDGDASIGLGGEAPDGPGHAIAVGLLVYHAATASYRLDVETWRPWTPSP